MSNQDLTTAQVANILGVHRNTVSKLVKEGKLNPYRISGTSGRMRFTMEDVDNFKNSTELKMIQPSWIVREYSYLIESDSIPFAIEQNLNQREKDYLLDVIKSANVQRIFGQYLQRADMNTYRDAISDASELWVSETYMSIKDIFIEKNRERKDDEPIYAPMKNISIGIGSLRYTVHDIKYIVVIIFHSEKGDIILSGNMQQYCNINKGLMIMERELAESFFVTLEEIPTIEYFAMNLDNSYHSYIRDFLVQATKEELEDEPDEDMDGIDDENT